MDKIRVFPGRHCILTGGSPHCPFTYIATEHSAVLIAICSTHHAPTQPHLHPYRPQMATSFTPSRSRGYSAAYLAEPSDNYSSTQTVLLSPPPRVAALPLEHTYRTPPPMSKCSSAGAGARKRPRGCRPTLSDIPIPPPVYYRSRVGMTRVLNRLIKANKIRVETCLREEQQPQHVVVNIGFSESFAAQCKGHHRDLHTRSTSALVPFHPALLVLVVIFVLCLGGIRFWPI